MRAGCRLLMAGLLTATAIDIASAAPVLSTVVTFNGTNGSSPWGGLIAGRDGLLYGATAGGPSGPGTLFRLNPSTSALTTLANISSRSTLVIDSFGNLYGTGTRSVFKFNATTHSLETLTQAVSPTRAVALDAEGNLYGSAKPGLIGSTNYSGGALFRIDHITGALSVVAPLPPSNGVAGVALEGGAAIDSAGNVFGTIYQGSLIGYPDNYGGVFRYTPGQSAVTFMPFTGDNGGYAECNLTIDPAGNVFGASTSGGPGAIGAGAVFTVHAGTTQLVALAGFDGIGAFPSAGAPRIPLGGVIVDAAGNLFGTTSAGNTSQFPGAAGTIYRIDAVTHAVTHLAGFTDGWQPRGSLFADAQGTLWGTTKSGGANGLGTIFKLTGSGYVVPEPTMLAWIVMPALLHRRR